LNKSTLSILLSFAIGLGIINLSILFYQSKKNDKPNIQDNGNKSQIRGMVVFQTYCVLCHGEKGDGTGRLATGKIPPPANLTKTMLNDEQLKAIIRGGGASVGRSEFMPPWGEELNDSQINDLIEYIHVLKTK
jgi:mono/diheme cytochrome c family protein